MRIYAYKHIKELEEREFDEFMGKISEEKRNRVLRFRRKKDSEMCLMAEIILRYIICRDYGAKNEDIDIKKGEKGKPEFNGKLENIHFNYSHSGDWILLAVDDSHIGIDVEEIKDISMDIAKRFFSEEEYRDLMMKKNREDYFFSLWTLKESYVKWDGRGLGISLKEFYFKIEEEEIRFYSKKDNRTCNFKSYYIEEDYKVGVCSKKSDFPIEIEKINDRINILTLL